MANPRLSYIENMRQIDMKDDLLNAIREYNREPEYEKPINKAQANIYMVAVNKLDSYTIDKVLKDILDQVKGSLDISQKLWGYIVRALSARLSAWLKSIGPPIDTEDRLIDATIRYLTEAPYTFQEGRCRALTYLGVFIACAVKGESILATVTLDFLKQDSLLAKSTELKYRLAKIVCNHHEVVLSPAEIKKEHTYSFWGLSFELPLPSLAAHNKLMLSGLKNKLRAMALEKRVREGISIEPGETKQTGALPGLFAGKTSDLKNRILSIDFEYYKKIQATEEKGLLAKVITDLCKSAVGNPARIIEVLVQDYERRLIKKGKHLMRATQGGDTFEKGIISAIIKKLRTVENDLKDKCIEQNIHYLVSRFNDMDIAPSPPTMGNSSELQASKVLGN